MFALSLLSLPSIAQDTLLNSITQGKISGDWRNYFMATTNQGVGQDWFALATGGNIKYETGTFKHFSIGLAAYHTSNLWSNIDVKDSITGKISRYESGLFDVADLTNKEMTLIGEAYLQYANKSHQIKVGRFKLKSPFINAEDGRMIPTLEQGVYYQFKPNQNFIFSNSFITHISPRSTSRFYAVDKSIGLYPLGKNPDGSTSGYLNNLNSLGLVATSLYYKKNKLDFKVWNYFVENVFNTFFIEPNFSVEHKKSKHIISLQYLNQIKINNGGNDEDNKAYFHDQTSNVVGVKYKFITKSKWHFSANFNHITNDGQFLFPREWGREFFFVFQKRERLEGMSNSTAWVVDVQKVFKMKRRGFMNVKLGYGQYYRTDAKDFANNKYAFPSNDQLNLDIFYFANNSKKGFSFEWLTAYKRAIGNTYDNQNFILNKVNMISHNLIVHYTF